MWDQVMWYVEHPNGIDALLCLALLVVYLWRYGSLDLQRQRIHELLDAGCILMAAEQAREWVGEGSGDDERLCAVDRALAKLEADGVLAVDGEETVES